MTAEERVRIDAMSHVEMARMWRHAGDYEPLLSGETGDYFRKVLFETHGGFTPAISREIGW